MNCNENKDIVENKDIIDFLFPSVIVNEEKAKEYDDIMADKYRNAEKQRKIKQGIPINYVDVTFDDFIASDNNLKIFKDKIIQYCNGIKNKTDNTSLVFSGEYGTGKTLLSCIICNELQGRYTRASYLINELLQSRSFSNSETTNEVIRRYGTYNFLIIDEIGRGTKNDSEIDLIFQVINERIENGLPTILVTNLSITDLSNYFGNAFRDRLKRWKVCNFNWGSKR